MCTRESAIGAWTLTARAALTAAQERRDPQPEIDRVHAMRRWVEAQGFWSPDDDLPAEVEMAIRRAIRAGRR